MKIPMKWLREYVDTDISAEAYAKQMILTGTAVEGIEKTGEEFDKVVVGYVVSCEPHPNSDHLHVCMVDVGENENLQIVCGAPNVREGMYVAVALEGAKLPGGTIKRGVLRGVESRGMLCSGAELELSDGLYPNCGEAGIMEILEEYPLGMDVKEAFGLGDDIIDFEILANRPDCLSVWGIAHESAAVLDTHCVMPEISVEEDTSCKFEDYATVQVLDPVNCPRYCARVIKDVKIRRSPKWMREYLYGAGVRPINNIVDITNFVMLETGHPMHAFDLDKVRDNTIIVRRAKPGEELTTLDGKEHVLSEDMLVIADHYNATGLAGIMGGEESEILDDTKTVLFECAAFDRTNNRLTSRKLGIRTEASGRFEKGVCQATALEAIERACMLVNMLECGNVVSGAFDFYPNPISVKPVKASVERISRLIGIDISGEAMEDILNRLDIDATLENGVLTCVPPVYRQDIETEADISEEVLRMYGYEHIPSTLMNAVTMPGKRSTRQEFTDRVKRSLIGMGLTEILNYSFISPKWLENMGFDDWRMAPIKLRNPLGEDTSVMRTTLVPSMLNTIAANIDHGNSEGAVFELSSVFKPVEGELPDERLTLCIGMFGEKADFYGVKGVLNALFTSFGVSASIKAAGDEYYHPGRKAIMLVNGVELARLGEIHPDVAEKFGIDRRVYVAEVELSVLSEHEKRIYGVKELPKYPAVTRDIALVVDESEGAGAILDAISKAGGHILESVSLFDIYRGDKLGDNKKSLAYTLTFRASDRTLTDGEIANSMEKILSALSAGFGAEIRK